jgi:hypothetical protein
MSMPVCAGPRLEEDAEDTNVGGRARGGRLHLHDTGEPILWTAPDSRVLRQDYPQACLLRVLTLT